jgi:hypothetical protein
MPSRKGLIFEGYCGEYVVIFLVPRILNVFKNCIEILHALTTQKPNVSDETGYATSGKCTSRESDENNLISRDEIGGYE